MTTHGDQQDLALEVELQEAHAAAARAEQRAAASDAELASTLAELARLRTAARGVRAAWEEFERTPFDAHSGRVHQVVGVLRQSIRNLVEALCRPGRSAARGDGIGALEDAPGESGAIVG